MLLSRVEEKLCYIFNTVNILYIVLYNYVPLRGVDCFSAHSPLRESLSCIRPLAGCRLFHSAGSARARWWGIRPLAGCRLFRRESCSLFRLRLGIRPLAGCRLFRCEDPRPQSHWPGVFVPLRGVDCRLCQIEELGYSSPCGV